MRKFNNILPKLVLLLALLAFSCTGTKKGVAGGTSEETNALAGVQKATGMDGQETALSFEKP